MRACVRAYVCVSVWRCIFVGVWQWAGRKRRNAARDTFGDVDYFHSRFLIFGRA